jgi:hypothetical protein
MHVVVLSLKACKFPCVTATLYTNHSPNQSLQYKKKNENVGFQSVVQTFWTVIYTSSELTGISPTGFIFTIDV